MENTQRWHKDEKHGSHTKTQTIADKQDNQEQHQTYIQKKCLNLNFLHVYNMAKK